MNEKEEPIGQPLDEDEWRKYSFGPIVKSWRHEYRTFLIRKVTQAWEVSGGNRKYIGKYFVELIFDNGTVPHRWWLVPDINKWSLKWVEIWGI